MTRKAKKITGLEIQYCELTGDQLSHDVMDMLICRAPFEALRVYVDGFLIYDNIDAVLLYRTTGVPHPGTFYTDSNHFVKAWTKKKLISEHGKSPLHQRGFNLVPLEALLKEFHE